MSDDEAIVRLTAAALTGILTRKKRPLDYSKEVSEVAVNCAEEALQEIHERGWMMPEPDIDNPPASAAFVGYKSGFSVGDRVRLAPGKGVGKYNRRIIEGLRSVIGIVVEPPNPKTWPDDAVQVRCGGSEGAVDADVIEKIPDCE